MRSDSLQEQIANSNFVAAYRSGEAVLGAVGHIIEFAAMSTHIKPAFPFDGFIIAEVWIRLKQYFAL